jgi:hypothetical protein
VIDRVLQLLLEDLQVIVLVIPLLGSFQGESLKEVEVWSAEPSMGMQMVNFHFVICLAS